MEPEMRILLFPFIMKALSSYETVALTEDNANENQTINTKMLIIEPMIGWVSLSNLYMLGGRCPVFCLLGITFYSKLFPALANTHTQNRRTERKRENVPPLFLLYKLRWIFIYISWWSLCLCAWENGEAPSCFI